nr:class I SAM-dependent methyltransferase [Nitrospiraceae bacterium]
HARLAGTHWWYYGTNSFFARLIKRHVKSGARILDAGCGAGGLLSALKKDYAVAGVDVSETALGYCRQRGIENICRGTVEALPFESGTFSGVVSLDVLYHREVKSDLAALREMVRVLEPGGFLFIQLPAYQWLKSGHDRVAHGQRRYTAAALGKLLDSCGLERTKLAYRMTFLFPLAAAGRVLARGRGSDLKEVNPLVNNVLKTLMRAENFLAERFDMPFGLSVIAVARKSGTK